MLVCLVVCYFFSPRFVIWSGLHIPEASFNPEVNRAVDALKQLQEPFVNISNTSNVAINYRLFFPIIGHWLRFPVWLYLILPHLGCVIAVGYLIRLVWLHTGQRNWGMMAACALACSDWFFVSIGWLTYFDSWFVFGLLVLSFSSSRLAIGATCLVEPWIDERFILALPMCLVVRFIYELEWRKRGWGALLMDLGLIALLTLPYVGVRMVLLLTKDANSVSYVQNLFNELKTVPLWRLLDGVWSGFRVAWLYAAICCVAVWCRQKQWIRIMTLIVVAGELVLGATVAGDISRSMAMLLPAVLLGLLMMCSWRPKVSQKVLWLVMVANLLLPASHVVWSFKLPIYYFYHELGEFRNPPGFVNPVAYINEGGKLLEDGRVADAKHCYDNAIVLNSRLPEAYLGRGVANLTNKDFHSARLDLERALQLQPQWASALHYHELAIEGELGISRVNEDKGSLAHPIR